MSGIFRQRYLKNPVLEDLKEKMVFIGGPRQVGKTTFALSLLSRPRENHPAYLSWDTLSGREAILKERLPPGERLVILDEVHKYVRWRNTVKGLYDTHKSSVSFLITGSARLDHYRRGGDSLQGRYHFHRLHPFSLREITARPTAHDVASLLRFGGFPEPATKGTEIFWRRWQRERLARVIHEDIRDLENVREITLLDLLAEELPNRVGSPLSIRNLATLLQTSSESVERWVSIFERLYLCFRIAPYGAPKIRAVKKERKLYLWDWSGVPTPGERFENLVACQLLKYCHFIEDTEGYPMELRFLRDTDKREVDFVVLKDRRPLFAVECKSGERQTGPAMPYFRERTAIPAFYQTHLGSKDYGVAETGVRVLPFHTLCSDLNLP